MRIDRYKTLCLSCVCPYLYLILSYLENLFYRSFITIVCKINTKRGSILKKTTKSLLEELNSITFKKNNEAIIESRATHVIDSAINLISLIRENFTPEQAYELERRLINSIKGGDSTKFVRSIRRLRDSKETARGLTVINGDLKDED